MVKKFNAELAEKIRAEKYREASEQMVELEQKRLNAIFSTLGDTDTQCSLRSFLNFSQDKFSTLNEIRNAVEAGDREAMMILLAVVMDSFRNFEVLPQDVREALADGVEKMRNNLEDSKKFLPRKRGQKAADRSEELATALQVEKIYSKGGKLLTAILDVVEQSGLKESLVRKRWGRHRKEAKAILHSGPYAIAIGQMIISMRDTASGKETSDEAAAVNTH